MIDVATLESGLDVIALLDHWGVDADVYRCGYGAYRSNCFLHGGTGVSSLSLTLSNGRYWMRCWSHGCNMSLIDYGISTGRTFGDVMRDYEMYQGESDGKRGRVSAVGGETCYLPPDAMDKYDKAIHKSYIDLGYNRDVLLDVFSVRFCSDPNDIHYGRVIYPIRDRLGRIVSLQSRRTSVCPPDASKYMFTPGYSAKDSVYGGYEQRDRLRNAPYILVCESPKGVYRGYQLNIPTLALMGIRWTQRQVIALASYGKPLVLIADNDASNVGYDGMRELVYALRQYVPVRLGMVGGVGMDVSDSRTRNEWMDIICGSQII